MHKILLYFFVKTRFSILSIERGLAFLPLEVR